MSEQYLSQDEIDALLDTQTGESQNTPAQTSPAPESTAGESLDQSAPGQITPSASGEIKAYDLARQERIIRGRMPALELIHERFARSLGLAMFRFMQRNPEINHTPSNVSRYSDFLQAIPIPSSINVMQTRPLAGSALLVLDGNLVSTIVDVMFGGSGRLPKKQENREFSLTEQRIIQKLIELSCMEYCRAWQSIHPFEMIFSRSESYPQFANIAIPTEMVVGTSFTLSFGELSGSMYICIPYSVLEPIRDTLSSPLNTQGATDKRAWTGQISRELQPTAVDMVAELTTATLTVREILGLSKGDVIEIEPGPDATLKIGEVPIFSGRYGEHNNRYAVRIDKVHTYTDSFQD